MRITESERIYQNTSYYKMAHLASPAVTDNLIYIRMFITDKLSRK